MNVIITLTTIPTRLITFHNYDIRYCIESLLNQNFGEYEIHFNIPEKHNQSGEPYVLPDWLVEMEQSNSKLNIFRTEDYGPITKLLPTLKRVTDPETIIIVVDDDMVYHSELINEHIKNREKWPNNPVGYDGLTSLNDDGSGRNTFNNSRDYFFSANGLASYVQILQHYKSVSYRRGMFEEDIYDFISEYGAWCDDTSLSAYFSMKKIPRVVTYYELDEVAQDFDEWLGVVGKSFPIVRGTDHETMEGCHIFRHEEKDKHKFQQLNVFLSKGFEK